MVSEGYASVSPCAGDGSDIMTRRKRKEIRKKRILHAAKPKMVRQRKVAEARDPRLVNYLAEEHPEL